METINVAIEVPQGLNINLTSIKSKITEYAKNLIKSQSVSETNEMKQALTYIQSLAVPGGEHAPIAEDGIESLIAEKYL